MPAVTIPDLPCQPLPATLKELRFLNCPVLASCCFLYLECSSFLIFLANSCSSLETLHKHLPQAEKQSFSYSSHQTPSGWYLQLQGTETPLGGLMQRGVLASPNCSSGNGRLWGRLRAWSPQFPQLCFLTGPSGQGARVPTSSGIPSLQDSSWKGTRGHFSTWMLSGRERTQVVQNPPETSVPASSACIWTDRQQRVGCHHSWGISHRPPRPGPAGERKEHRRGWWVVERGHRVWALEGGRDQWQARNGRGVCYGIAF